jgi:enterochelin esterase family protein
MLKQVSGLMTILLLSTSVAYAQPPARPGAGQPPAGGRGRGGGPQYVSPDVGADRAITFRYVAPNARQVTVSGELDGKPHPMTKGENGMWTTTVGPLPPDIYTYSFNVDGVVTLDPANPNTKYGYGRFGAVSIVQVPGDGPAFYDVKPVPHGEVRIRPYVSKTMGVSRTLWVYTPPNYDRGSNFPVLYLFHGGGDIESGWTMIGRASNILDNLIAEGKARPMVVVMPLGHAVQSFWAGPARPSPNAPPPGGGRAQPSPSASAGPAGATASGRAGATPGPVGLNLFGRELVEEVMPLVEQTYKVSKRPEHRAIGGLSMGGGLTMNVAFNRPNLFGHVIIMSSGGQNAEASYPGFFKNAAAINKQFKLFWIAIGKDDALVGGGSKALTDALTKAGITHTYLVTEGRHEWTVWRHHLREFVPLLFKDTKSTSRP